MIKAYFKDELGNVFHRKVNTASGRVACSVASVSEIKRKSVFVFVDIWPKVYGRINSISKT